MQPLLVSPAPPLSERRTLALSLCPLRAHLAVSVPRGLRGGSDSHRRHRHPGPWCLVYSLCITHLVIKIPLDALTLW